MKKKKKESIKIKDQKDYLCCFVSSWRSYHQLLSCHPLIFLMPDQISQSHLLSVSTLLVPSSSDLDPTLMLPLRSNLISMWSISWSHPNLYSSCNTIGSSASTFFILLKSEPLLIPFSSSSHTFSFFLY